MAYFLDLSPELAKTTELNSTTKLILGRIRAFPDGCPLALKDFCSELGLSSVCVCKNIQILCQKGYIERGKYGLLQANR